MNLPLFRLTTYSMLTNKSWVLRFKSELIILDILPGASMERTTKLKLKCGHWKTIV